MHEFRLAQISDTHLARRLQKLTDNFHRVSEHIDATRPDLIVNTGDLAFDAQTSPDDLKFAKELHDALPVPCRHLPAITTSATTRQPSVPHRSGPRRSRSGRNICPSSARTAGASTKPAGALSG